MKQIHDIEQEVNRTLESIDKIQRAGANPYLFTRIKASIQTREKSVWNAASNFISKPLVAFAAILIAILINVFMFLQTNDGSNQPADTDQVFASEYNLPSTTT